MAEFSIGEVERLTSLPAHTLRYWEETIPFIRPRKDDRGRRVYSSRDVELIERVKHLVQDRKYTLEGAGERLLRELTGAAAEASVPSRTAVPSRAADGQESARLDAARKTLAELRADLLELYELVRRRSDTLS